MDVKKAIATRRSIRKYQSREVSDNLIKDLIEAARLAPSGHNSQPSRFRLIQHQEAKNKLKKGNIFRQEFVYEAPVIIVCCADPDVYPKGVKGLDEPNKIRCARDLSLASAFLVLRATELGLGTCFVGWVSREKIKKILHLPKKYIIPYAITVGYPAERPEPRPRKNINDIII